MLGFLQNYICIFTYHGITYHGKLDLAFARTMLAFLQRHAVIVFESARQIFCRNEIGGWGVLNREIFRFVSFVRAYAWSGCLVELDLKRHCCVFPFSLCGPPGILSPLFAPPSFPFSLPPHLPNLLSNFSWAFQ